MYPFRYLEVHSVNNSSKRTRRYGQLSSNITARINKPFNPDYSVGVIRFYTLHAALVAAQFNSNRYKQVQPV